MIPQKQLNFPESKYLSVYEMGQSLIIEIKYSKLKAFAIIGFSLVWALITFIVSSAFIIQENLLEPPFRGESFLLLFFLLFYVIGLFTFYCGLTYLFNKTTIEIAYGEIIISIKPLPWFGNKTINTSEIKQIYVKERSSTNKNGQTTYSYDVMLINKQENKTKLLSSLDSSNIAKFIEQKLEKFLKIQNVPVDGEYQ